MTAHTTTPPSRPGVQGDCFEAIERLVVAPEAGVFEPPQRVTLGSVIAVGQIVGHLSRGADRIPGVSPFVGRTAEKLAWSGERLTAHQPVIWLSTGSRTL